MAENRIGRRVKKTTCKCTVIEKDNTINETTVVLYGNNYDVNQAQKKVRKKLKNERVLVRSVEHSDFYCSMPIETFIKYGTRKA